MKTGLKFVKFFVLFTAFVVVFFFLGLFLGGLVKGKSMAETIDGMGNAGLLEAAGVIVLAIASLFVAAAVHVIVHELGHLVFGLASGYRFISFQALGFALVREDTRFRFKRFSIAGAAGQCLMLPPEARAADIPVVAYNAGGVLFNLFLTLSLALLLCLSHPSPWAAVVLAIAVCVGVFAVVINGIPMVLGGGLPNDGYNIFRLRRNPRSREAFIELLRLSALIKEGTRPKDFPLSSFINCTEVDFSEPLQVNLYSAYASFLLDSGHYDRCEAVCREIVAKEKRVKILVLDAKCELACLLFMKGSVREARSLLDEKELKMVEAMSRTMSSKKRFFFFSSLYGDGDLATARSIYNTVLAQKDTYLVRGEVLMDLTLMQSAIPVP